MREEKVQELKSIRASLLEFAKGETFGEWDTDSKEIKNALKSLAIAIEYAEKRTKKRYIGVFCDVKTKEEYEIPFYSMHKAGSYMNESDAWSAKYAYCNKNGLRTEDIRFVESYREKEN